MPIITRYPLDPTGVNPNNLVQGELHSMPRRTVRAIATLYGAFFTESLIVVDTASNLTLVQGTQYYAGELYDVPTARFGKEVCAIIVITDPTVGDEVSIQYQAVGGDFSTSSVAIIQMLDNLSLDDRPVAWPNIINRPSEFPPTPHLHDVGDTYGWEDVVLAVDRLSAAVTLGDAMQHEGIYQYIDSRVGAITPEIQTLIATAVADAIENAGGTIGNGGSGGDVLGNSSSEDELYFLENS